MDHMPLIMVRAYDTSISIICARPDADRPFVTVDSIEVKGIVLRTSDTSGVTGFCLDTFQLRVDSTDQEFIQFFTTQPNRLYRISRRPSNIQTDTKDCRDSGDVTGHFTRNLATRIDERTIDLGRAQTAHHNSIFE
jgi:hypothetical protein